MPNVPDLRNRLLGSWPVKVSSTADWIILVLLGTGSTMAAVATYIVVF